MVDRTPNPRHLAEVERFTARKEVAASSAGWAAVDAFQRSAQMAERSRCQRMLAEYEARGHTESEIVEYAFSLLRTDY